MFPYMEWINYLSQMFNRSRSRLVQDFLKNPSVLYSFLTPRICDTTGKPWLASPVGQEHILVTIPAFSVAMKSLCVISINWKRDLWVNLHCMFLFLCVEGVLESVGIKQTAPQRSRGHSACNKHRKEQTTERNMRVICKSHVFSSCFSCSHVESLCSTLGRRVATFFSGHRCLVCFWIRCSWTEDHY